MHEKIAYRPEVDGLRAVAVVAVILYHAEFALGGGTMLEGGYLGVDIFFVISGYLISKIILTELQATGRIDFVNFYVRRARRILPILLTVMLASFPFAWMNLLPDAFHEYARSILAALLFFSNHFFHAVTTSYGADSSLLKPFLHTWSLSVEEQFYIVFPVTLLLLHKYVARRMGIVMLAGAALSLQLAETLGASDPELNFYILPTRAWELLAGAMLARLDLLYGRQRLALLCKKMPALGVLFIAVPLMTFDGATHHPGFATLLLVLGTAMVVFFANPQEPVGMLLGSRPFVGTGLISYGLYLWHFPVFAFARIREPASGNADKLEWIALALALSVASYFIIEKPFRNRIRIPAVRAFQAMGLALVLTVGLSAGSYVTEGYEGRVWPVFGKSMPETPKSPNDGALCNNRPNGFCQFEAFSSKFPISIIGDSHAHILASELAERLRGVRTIKFLTTDSCIAMLDADLSTGATSDAISACTAQAQRNRLAAIAESGPSVVVVSSRLQRLLEGPSFDNKEGGISRGSKYEFRTRNGESVEDAITAAIQLLLDRGNFLILVHPVPEVGWRVPEYLFRKRPLREDQVPDYLQNYPLTTSYAVYRERTRSSFALLDRIENPNLHRVYPHELLCDKQIRGRCVTHDTEKLFYRDSDHVNKFGAEMIDDLIMEKIRLIDAKNAAVAAN